MTKKILVLASCLLFAACTAPKEGPVTMTEEGMYEVSSAQWAHMIPEHMKVMFDLATVEIGEESDKPLCGANSYMVKVTERTIAGYEGCVEEMEDHANGLQIYYYDSNLIKDGINISVELDLSELPCGPMNSTDLEITECDNSNFAARDAFDPVVVIEAILKQYEEFIK